MPTRTHMHVRLNWLANTKPPINHSLKAETNWYSQLRYIIWTSIDIVGTHGFSFRYTSIQPGRSISVKSFGLQEYAWIICGHAIKIKIDLFVMEDSLVTTNMTAPSNGMTTCALYTNGIFPIRNLDIYVTDQLVSNSVEQTCIHSGKNYMYCICITLYLILSGWTRLYMAAIINNDINTASFLLASQCDKTSLELFMNYSWVQMILRICSYRLNGSVTEWKPVGSDDVYRCSYYIPQLWISIYFSF
jgi:hypothetical protein